MEAVVCTSCRLTFDLLAKQPKQITQFNVVFVGRSLQLDMILNERISGTTEVGEISKKLQESKLKCYGHVLRRKLCGQESDCDGGAGENNFRNTGIEVVG